jgi:hypothetical protein
MSLRCNYLAQKRIFIGLKLPECLRAAHFAPRAFMPYSRDKMHGLYSREQSQRSSGMSVSWSRWLGVLCIALVLLTGFIQVVHSHPTGQVDHEGCSLCNTAHHVVQTVALASVAVSIQPVWRIASEKPLERPRHIFIHKLANRPPPVSLIAA